MAVPTWNGVLMLLRRPNDRLRAAIHALLILMLASGLAQLTWRLLPAQPLDAPLVVASTVNIIATEAGDSSLQQQIPMWHLFGKAEIKAREVVSAPVPEDLPETKLHLTLRGMIASPDPSMARAIIADPAKKENFYKIGDKLPGNATLTEIYGDRIVIKRGNNFETLTLPKDALDLAITMPSAAALQNTRRRQTSNGRNVSGRVGSKSYTLKEYRDTLLSDPQKVSDLVRLSQARKNGKFVGYTLNPGRDPRFLSRHGLVPGDVVTEINGVKLDSPTKGFSLMKDIKSAETLELVVDRDGILQRFTLPIN